MGDVRTFDLSKLIVLVNTTRIGPGFADGDAIAIEWTKSMWTNQGGSQGEYSRSASNDRSGTIRIMLKQTADSNDVLDVWRMLGERLGVGDIFKFSATDLGGRTVLVAEKAYITDRPNISFGQEAGSREWKLFSPDIDAKIGGNA